jgi:branched-subunit amino acid transport protein
MCRYVVCIVAIDACHARSNVIRVKMADWFYFGWVVLGMISATVFTRSAFLLLPTRWQLSSGTLSALRYAPIAAIAAIVAPDLITWRPTNASFHVSDALNPKLIAALIAAGIHWRYTNMLLSIAVGMSAFWGLRYVAGLGMLG